MSFENRIYYLHRDNGLIPYPYHELINLVESGQLSPDEKITCIFHGKIATETDSLYVKDIL